MSDSRQEMNIRNSERRRDSRSRSPRRHQSQSYRSRSPVNNHRDTLTSSSHFSEPALLLKLPRELRDLVYGHLFDSTRLTFGYRQVNFQYRKVLPSRNALAILRVCSQLYLEAGELWLKRVLFDFEDTMTLMDKFSQLPIASLKQIRNVRIRMMGDEPSPPESINDEHQWRGLQVLEGLQLDRLTVVPSWGTKYNGCEDIKRFMVSSFPCKELFYFTPRSVFHETDQTTPAEASTLLTRRINDMADDLKSRGDFGTGLTMTIFQSSEPDSKYTGTSFKNSAIEVLAETGISPDPAPDKMIACGKSLKPNVETLIIFKPAATTSTLSGASIEGVLKTVDDKRVRKTWRDDYRDEYIRDAQEQSPDMENITTGELFPWPYDMRKGYTIIDHYNNVDDIIWPGKNHDQAWEGVLDN
ncbi:6208e4d2-1d28-40e6-bcad-cbdd176db681 [Sclerotinia trifoliorum]|uniref:6208e4d2-1d28-40e6-bcad-cbdd176db681 n=1 Tax=Sclerotinia trifoliorum TaxID=28548 RepID=A0A8H2ZKK5_9HELO|nr:6208e4d2-1d28-40e6-bcad-cbdd176db681 [Sclerotinia trifoliorum]